MKFFLSAILALTLALGACRSDEATYPPEAVEAFHFAAVTLSLPVKGQLPPTVITMTPGADGKFLWGGSRVVGNYSWERNLFGKLTSEKIRVVWNDDPVLRFSNLAHEMVHVLRQRRGEPSTEAEAEMVEALAKEYKR